MIITITGHRPERLKKENEERVYEWLKEKYDKYAPTRINTGMAQGVDQICAWVCKEFGWNFKAYYAFKKQLAPEEEYLINSGLCVDVDWGKDRYTGKNNYIDRDKKMVDECDMVLAVWDGVEAGGTWQTIKYAKEKNKEIEILYVNQKKS